MPTTKLPKFEGKDVTRSAVKITRAGDGLSEALKLAPEALKQDEEVYFVLKGSVQRVSHEPADKEDAEHLMRVHTVATEEITRVDGDLVDAFLTEAAERVALLKEAEEGIQRLDVEGNGNGDEE